MFNESGNLPAYIAEVTRVLLGHDGLDAQVLFIDDGSTDDSWRSIEQIARRNPAFRGIRLSRNFGSHVALAAGIDNVPSGTDAVATLACDLQDPPETVLGFVERWRAGADIVWGARRERADGGWRVGASRLLESTLRRHAMPRNSKFRTGSFLLMDRAVVDCFLQYREHSRVTFALVAWTGFEQSVVEYDRQARTSGRAGWAVGRMLNPAYDVLIGFSPMPAKVVTGIGVSMFFLSIFGLIYLVAAWFFTSVQPGWTGIMAILMLFFGLLFMMVFHQM